MVCVATMVCVPWRARWLAHPAERASQRQLDAKVLSRLFNVLSNRL